MLASVPLEASLDSVNEWSDRTITTYGVIMSSLEHTRIRAWYTLPNGTPPVRGWPAILTMPSYSGNLVLPGFFARYGYATLSLYPRAQGESQHEWVLDQDLHQLLYNITDPDSYYFRGAYMDCIRGLDFLESRSEVDAGRLAVTGSSQGGGLTLATASLDSRVKTAIARLPSLCNFPVALEEATLDAFNHGRILKYLTQHPDRKGSVMETLAYFDNINLVENINCPILMSVAMKDVDHPYRAIMSVFERIPTFKSIVVYRSSTGLETGGSNVDFNRHSLNWLERYLN
jgi:cephalosporin-C deacetylase